MRVLFAGTPDFAVTALKALAQEHEIVGVFTQPDRKSGRGKKLTPTAVKTAAEVILSDQGLNSSIYQPSNLKDQSSLIKQLNPDIMVVVAYGMLLPQSILDIPRLGCVNIHASILPRWRGAAPIQRAIEAGDKEAGVAIMKMELGLDTGPVYDTLTTAILDTDTSASLHDKLAILGATGICKTLRRLSDNSDLTPIEQDHEKASYAKKILKSEAAIDWTLKAQEIQQKIRAFVPFPIAQSSHNGTRIRIWQAEIVNRTSCSEAPGQVVEKNDDGLTIQCGKGLLRLQTLQRDGSKALSWQNFANGYVIKIGDIFT